MKKFLIALALCPVLLIGVGFTLSAINSIEVELPTPN